MNKKLIALVLAIFIFPTTAVLADYGDNSKQEEEKKLQESPKNIPLQPSGTSPAPTFDPSGTPENLKTPPGIDSNNKAGNNLQKSGQIK